MVGCGGAVPSVSVRNKRQPIATHLQHIQQTQQSAETANKTRADYTSKWNLAVLLYSVPQHKT